MSTPATRRSTAGQPAASAAASRSSPSATNRPERSRHRRRWRSLRISLSFALCWLVIVIGETKKGAAPEWSGARLAVLVVRRLSAGRQRLTGAVGKASKRLGVAHGDVGQDLAVELHPGRLEAVDELRVRQAVLACGGVDPRDPQAAEVTLAVAPVAVAVLVGLEHGLLRHPVVTAGVAPVALGQRKRGAALLAGVDRTLDAGH